jgi:uncharacterized protein (DUF2249 family)
MDDMLIFASSAAALKALKKQLIEQYKMHDLDEAQQFLRLQITRTSRKIHIHQTAYLNRVLD